MPSFAQTLPVVVLVVASAFAAPPYVPGEGDVSGLSKADPPTEALSGFVPRLAARHSVSKAAAPVESDAIDDAHAEHAGKNAALGSASPSAAHRASCSPDFEGAGLRVVDSFGSLEFGPSAANERAPVISSSFRGDYAVDWHFEKTGQLDGVYIIKDVDNKKLAVRYARGQDDSIILDKASSSGKAPDQLWTVQCDTCSTDISEIHGNVASQCIIRPYAHQGGCVAVGPNPDNLAYVTTDSDACTKFDFFAN
ncbi:hypothetical protein BDZ89DRAFT_1116043 [Hymenopellis radicata]|nr:hypothetical protein BDZ89DRAFT_1116043 [Hymenopellis radicata]